MGFDDPISLDEKVANTDDGRTSAAADGFRGLYVYLAILLISGAVYLGCIISPPSLMDDVDAVQANISRTMLQTGDWVTARLDGVQYLEKAPLIYWTIAASYKVFGETDWAARIPVALSAMALCWLTAAFGVWAFGKRSGFCAGLVMSTCIGLFLFTRILIPDVMLVFTIALAMWAFLRALDETEKHPRLWAFLLAACLGTGLLLKSLIGALFPVATGVIYLLMTRQFFVKRTWQRLRPVSGALIALAIAAPWHVLATLHNPPYFDFTMRSVPGEYHGFLWFFFMNEQVLRFLNLRTPRDYDTVPRHLFILFHLLWLFPWSVYLPALSKLSFKPLDRAGQVRFLAACWTGFVLTFFLFSTTQEYYSMPCYPALALLLGSAMAQEGNPWIARGSRLMGVIVACAAAACFAILAMVWNLPAPGDISGALSNNPGAYKLSLGHMEDLTMSSFAYLRLPLGMAGVAFLTGAVGAFLKVRWKTFLAAAFMMVLFFQAARVAMVAFDPYLSSRPLAEAINRGPQGKVVIDHHYYTYSSVMFYSGESVLLLNAKFNNLVYGAAAPDAPPVFIDDAELARLWAGPTRYYVVSNNAQMERFEKLLGKDRVSLVAASGGKFVLTNR
jgi:4-amino-4-deoxy-L-arabinose transferase-like glycosyltransferase